MTESVATRPQVSMKITGLLSSLHEGKMRSAWAYGSGFRLYARKSVHVIDGKMTHCIDLANMEADSPGNGNFTAILDWLEPHLQTNGGGTIFVESILNPRLHKFLETRGYTLHEPAGVRGTEAPLNRFKTIKGDHHAV